MGGFGARRFELVEEAGVYGRTRRRFSAVVDNLERYRGVDCRGGFGTAARAGGDDLSRRIESAVFEDWPGRCFDKRAERVFGAVAALAGHTEFVLQLLQRSDTARRRGADLPVGDAVANANVHVRVARCSSVNEVNVVKIRMVVNI